MKIYKYVGFCGVLLTLISACKKDSPIPATSALNIINASAEVPSLAVNFTNPPMPFYKQHSVIAYGSAAEYGRSAGPTPLALVSSSDTTKSIFGGSLNLLAGKLYSLYLYGSLAKVDTLLLQDNIPFRTDSTSGFRLINLSSDSGPVSVYQAGSTSNDFSALTFKKITMFKSYPATSTVINNGGYNFELTDASGNVLTTFSWTPQVFQNYTFVVSGNGASGYQVFQVNNF